MPELSQPQSQEQVYQITKPFKSKYDKIYKSVATVQYEHVPLFATPRKARKNNPVAMEDILLNIDLETNEFQESTNAALHQLGYEREAIPEK